MIFNDLKMQGLLLFHNSVSDNILVLQFSEQAKHSVTFNMNIHRIWSSEIRSMYKKIQ